MDVVNFTDKALQVEGPISIALGYFDGLHLAHQEVIGAAVAYGREHHIKSAVLTFSPNPNVILKKLDCEHLLTPHTEKVKRLAELGVDYLIILPFDEKMAQMGADDFIQTYLIGLNVLHVVTGFDFRFGKFGEGDVSVLKRYSSEFKVTVIEKRELSSEKIGATQIKGYLAVGNVEKVSHMLGRPYRLTGTVVTGQQKGRLIGCPTANLHLLDSFICPAKGVYAVKVIAAGKSFMGMCNIGHNPTFNFIEEVSIEVHILNFNGDLYGQELSIDFYQYLRSEKKFNSISELMEQLEIDRNQVATYFKINLK
ncbi:MAG: riboflavin biosynthesis protein RibF [Turicibacter sp.]